MSKTSHQAILEFYREQTRLLKNLSWAAFSDQDDSAYHFAEYIESISNLCDLSCSWPGFGGLHNNEETAFTEFEQDIAKKYGAAAAAISLNGTSGANGIVLGHCVTQIAPGRSISLVETNCHKSVVGALCDAGRDIVWIDRPFCQRLGVSRALDQSKFEEMILRYEDMIGEVVVTDPTYEGLFSDLSPLRKLVDTVGAKLIVDRAWSPLAGLVEDYGPSPMKHAHICSLSLHKKGLGPSMVSATLFAEKDDKRHFKSGAMLGRASTSPFAMLLMLAQHQFNKLTDGDFDIELRNARLQAQVLRENIAKNCSEVDIIDALSLGGIALDPAHITLSLQRSGYDGHALAAILRKDFQLIPEMASDVSLTLLFGPDHVSSREQIELAVLSAIARCPKQTSQIPVTNQIGKSYRTQPRDALHGLSEMVSSREAEGRIASDLQYFYPPGTARIAFGKSITEQAAEGEKAVSLYGEAGQTIRVLQTEKKHVPTLVDARIPDIKIACFPTSELPSSLAIQYPELYWETFCNAPYNQYFINPDKLLEPISPAAIIKGRCPKRGDYFSAQSLRQHADEKKLWMHPGVVTHNLMMRLGEDGYFAAVIDGAEKLLGFLHIRIAPISRIYRLEELSHPHRLSLNPDPSMAYAEEVFFKRLEQEVGLCAHDQVFYISAQGLHPRIRAKNGILFQMMSECARIISEKHRSLASIAEIPDQGAARIIDIATSDRLIPNLFPSGHDAVFNRHAINGMKHFQQGSRHFNRLLKTEIRRQREQNS